MTSWCFAGLWDRQAKNRMQPLPLSKNARRAGTDGLPRVLLVPMSPQAREARRYENGDGCPAMLSLLRHVPRENYHGPVVDTQVIQAMGRVGHATAARIVIEVSCSRRSTLAANRGCGGVDSAQAFPVRAITLHIAPGTKRLPGLAIAPGTTRYAGYRMNRRTMIDVAFMGSGAHGWTRYGVQSLTASRTRCHAANHRHRARNLAHSPVGEVPAEPLRYAPHPEAHWLRRSYRDPAPRRWSNGMKLPRGTMNHDQMDCRGTGQHNLQELL